MSRRKLAKAKAKRVSKARAAQAAKHDAIEAKTLLTVEKPKSGARRVFSLKGLRESLLTFGAIAGVLCMLMAVAAFGFDIKPVIFRSGSMSPAIDTGALAISHTVKAKDLAIGDIVTVKTSTGVRVTHRIKDLTLIDGKASMVLKGDANKLPDDKVYVVPSADRVLFDIPKAGYVVSWLSGSIGIFAGGLLAGLLVLTAFGPGTGNQKKPGARKIFGVSVATLTVGLISSGVAGTGNTQAYYTDTASAVSGTFSRQAAAVPVAPVINTCTRGITGIAKHSITWTEAVNPTTFEIRYTGSSRPVQSIVGTSRGPTPLTQDLNNEIGSFFLVAINASGTSLSSNLVNYGGEGSNKYCTVQP